MSYDIRQHIRMMYNEIPTDEEVIEIYDVVSKNVTGNDPEIEVSEDLRTDFNLDSHVSSKHDDVVFLNDIHNTSDKVRSVVMVDVNTVWGVYRFTKSDKTSQQDFINESNAFGLSVIGNISQSLKELSESDEVNNPE